MSENSSNSGSGGISAGNVLSALGFGINLLSMFQKPKKQRIFIYEDPTVAINIRKRKNLLEQQLAAKRAQLGAMGITNSQSAAAVQQRMASEAFDDIRLQKDNLYNTQTVDVSEEPNEKLNKALYQAFMTIGNKVIK